MTEEAVATFPIPKVMEIDKPFWDGVQKESLLVQKCTDCHKLQWFPRPVCLYCFSTNLGWKPVKGMGKVYSFTLVHIPTNPAVRQEVQSTGVPIIFAMVDLDEGVRMVTELVGCKPEEVKLGAKVKVIFEEAKGTNFKLPKFQLVK